MELNDFRNPETGVIDGIRACMNSIRDGHYLPILAPLHLTYNKEDDTYMGAVYSHDLQVWDI